MPCIFNSKKGDVLNLPYNIIIKFPQTYVSKSYSSYIDTSDRATNTRLAIVAVNE